MLWPAFDPDLANEHKGKVLCLKTEIIDFISYQNLREFCFSIISSFCFKLSVAASVLSTVAAGTTAQDDTSAN